MATPRHGIALVAALALLSLVALLVAGSFASMTLSERSSRGATSDEVLIASADYALNTVLASPSDYGLVDLSYGQPKRLGISIPGSDPVAASVTVTRLSQGTLWLVADASLARGDSAHRRVSLVARFQDPGALPIAPLEARGNVRLARGISFAADEATDPECARTAPNIATGPGSTVSSVDSVTSVNDAAAADSAAFFLTAAQIAALDSVGVRRVRGDTIVGGAGGAATFDGVLLVDGTLEIAGPWTVHGLVVARGPVRAATASLALTGAVLSFAPQSATPAIDLGAGSITWSPCTVQRALRQLVGVRPVRQRSWAEFF